MHENHLKHIASICKQKNLTCKMHIANRGDSVPLTPLNISRYTNPARFDRYGGVDLVFSSAPRMPSFSAASIGEFKTKVQNYMGQNFLNDVTPYKPYKRS